MLQYILSNFFFFSFELNFIKKIWLLLCPRTALKFEHSCPNNNLACTPVIIEVYLYIFFFAQNCVQEIPRVGQEWSQVQMSLSPPCQPALLARISSPHDDILFLNILVFLFYSPFTYLWIFSGLDKSGPRPRCHTVSLSASATSC